MIENDFLFQFLSLNPFFAVILVLIFDFITLLIPAFRSGSIRKLFTNIGFLIGDFVTLPLVAFLIVSFYKDNIFPQTSTEVLFVIFLISLSFTLISGFYFKLMKIYWVPHGIFHIIFGYLTLSFLIRAYGGGIT